jgi:hypothetical protein
MKTKVFTGSDLQNYEVNASYWFGRVRPSNVIVPRKYAVYAWDDADILFAVRATLLKGQGEVRNLRPVKPVAFNRVEDLVAYQVREPLLVRVGDDDNLASFVAIRPHPQDGVQVDKDLVDMSLSRALRKALRARKG